MSASEKRAILDVIKARSGGTLDDFRPSSRAGQIFRMGSGVYECIALHFSRTGRSLFCIELA
ncbi:MAG: hypothetical protein KDA47_22500, partial [Planctomycetales bacterium]|nr:hypothetical protein [Planctomycetales bacterium]